jgi:filamentous hemagglutinin
VGALGGSCGAAEGPSSLYDTSIAAPGANELNVVTDVGAQEFQSNLMSNGYQVVAQTVNSNGPVTVLSNGASSYTIYIRDSTGGFGALFNSSTGNLIKYVLGGP